MMIRYCTDMTNGFSTKKMRCLTVLVFVIAMSLCMTGMSFAVEDDDPNAGSITETTAPADDQKDAKESDPAEADPVPEDGVLEVTSPTGSYTVDFYFTSEDGTTTEYHMKGGSEMMLSELFKKLGIDRDTADIKKTVFTDNELVKFVKEGDDYRVISLKPFNTEESLTITFEDDEVIVLRVEDAVGPYNLGTSGGVKWEITNAGVLRIYPTNVDFGRIGGTNTNAENNNWPWKSYASQITSIQVDGVIGTMPNTKLINMFRGLNKAATADVSGFDFTTNADGDQVEGRGTVDSLANMFYECTSLTSVTGVEQLSSVNNKRTDFMFYNCSQLSAIQGIGELETKNVEQMQRMFSGCSGLETIDLSSWSNAGKVQNMQNMFRGCTSLTTVTMPGSNFKVKDNALLANMFQDCTALTSVVFGTAENHMDVTGAKTMTNMFLNCSSLTSLDVSTFGKLRLIANMDGFVEGCTALETLNIDNLDNSMIGPTNNRHSITSDQTGYIADRAVAAEVGAKEFGRALFGFDEESKKSKSIDSELPNLTTISAKNSKVWMVHNNRGTPGNEYYNAAENGAIYYFTKKVMEYQYDDESSVTIDSDRDYIDLITDRDGTNVYTTKPEQDPLPDASENINIKNGDLNTNGAGFLSPGVYTIGDSDREEPAEAPMCDTYYRIAYIGQVPYRVEGIDSDDPDLVKVYSADNTYINTKNRKWTETGDYVIDRSDNPIIVIYENAAVDMNGKKYDVVITVKKITFKGVDKVPTDPGSARVPHDGNNYVPSDRKYYRPILQANSSDGLQFHNYVWTGEPTQPWPGYRTNCLSKGSGTNIEFSIKIDDAPDDTSFVFKGEDLDVAASQEWTNDPDDACYDKLPIKENTYGIGGESFILGEGNVLGTVRFAKHTGLALVKGNNVVSTGSDPDTTWSEFTVKADAQGSDYTWTSGIGCTTYALRNTKAQNAGVTKLQPEVLKQLMNGTLAANQFEFELEEESKDPSTAPSPTNNDQEKGNAANGKVTFDIMKFGPAEGEEYYPGTDSQGDHNIYTYTYKVYEKIPTDAKLIDGKPVKNNIIYDNTQHKITVVISPPENETEMIQGIKAEIYVDKTPGVGVTPNKTYWHHEKACVDCSNGTLVNKAEDKWYDENGIEIDDPNPISLSDIKFKNIEIKPVEVTLSAQKILEGRPWKDSDEFAAALTLVATDTTTPMPENTTIEDDLRYSEISISNQDTPVKDGDETIGYKDNFGKITYNLSDLVDAQGDLVKEKTFTYECRELQPSETSVPSIPGVTYDAEPYKVNVTVKLDTTNPADPKLTYTVKYETEDGKSVTIPEFTNTYDAKQTIYKMEAVKDYHDVNKDQEVPLTGGEFEFVLKPIGTYAAIAPMPKNTDGTGANRTYTKTNEEDGDIQFEVETDPEDGLTFNYQDLLDKGITAEQLHSDDGVDFEYEMYEIIRDDAVNNDDGTWIYDDKENGIKYTYDGIHHTRKITVKVRTNDNDTPSDSSDDFDELYVEGHQDDHKVDFFIDKDGNEKAASTIPGYDPDKNHFKPGAEDRGAPIFINYKYEYPGEIGDDETYGLKNQTQTGSPDYEVIPKNPIDKSTLTLVKPDVPGASISEDGKVVTIPGEGTYTLNEDGTITFEPEKDYVGDPTPITVKGKDSRGNDVTGKYTPHVIDPTDKAKASRTIHFTYKTKDGKKVTSNVTQTETLTREATEVDPKTGKVTKWGPWNSVTFPAVKNPDKKAGKGWTTDDIAPALTVDKPGKVKDVYVVYHKKHYTVEYKDGDHGKSDGGTENKNYGDTPQKNNVTPSKGYRFTGKYRYVITDEDGNVIEEGYTTDPSSIKVIGNIVFTPIYEPVGNGGKKNSSATGDGSKPLLFGGIMLLAAIALAVVLIRRRSGRGHVE